MAKTNSYTPKRETAPAKSNRGGIAPAFDLATLIAGITKEKRHPEIGISGPAGKEAL